MPYEWKGIRVAIGLIDAAENVAASSILIDGVGDGSVDRLERKRVAV